MAAGYGREYPPPRAEFDSDYELFAHYSPPPGHVPVSTEVSLESLGGLTVIIPIGSFKNGFDWELKRQRSRNHFVNIGDAPGQMWFFWREE
jgi:hypothetical protein